MTTFLLVRHATNSTVGKILAGRMEGVSLNEEGISQAHELAARLAHLPVAAIYSSPLERAVETAAPIAAQLNLQTITSEDFLEIAFGDWTNTSFEELKSSQTFHRFNSFRSCTRTPGGETMLEAQLRIVNGLQTLHKSHRDQVVAVVSHGDVLKAAILFYAGMPLDLFQRIEISPASVSIVQIDDDTVRILLLNHTGEIKL
jgi:probable phosphomutase (TIGR03848 family)